MIGDFPPGKRALSNRSPSDPSKVAVYQQVRALMAERRFREAAQLAQTAGEQALKDGRGRAAAYFLYHAGRAYAVAGAWGESAASAVASRQVALKESDLRMASFASQLLASAYFVSEDFELADAEATRMRQYASREQQSSSMYVLLSAIASRRGQQDKALAFSRESVSLASATGGAEETALAFNELGLRLLNSGRAAAAEQFLVEAFRLRKLAGSRYLGQSYYNLGRLLLQKNQPQPALRMFSAAAENSSSETVPLPWVRYRMAEVFLAMGQPGPALREARTAARLSRDMRVAFPFGNDLQVRAEERIQDIYDLLLELLLDQFEQSKSPALLAEAFAATLENRATSLISRSEAAGKWQSNLSADYFAKLATLRNLEAEAMLPGRNVDAALARLRADLASAETSAGLGMSGGEETAGQRMERLNASLAPGEPLFVFHLGHARSYRFLLKDGALSVRTLPSRDSIAVRIEQFRRVVESNSPRVAADGQALYRELFGEALDDIHTPVITIVPDEAMYVLPFAALVWETRNGSPSYLVQKHAIRLAPSAFFFGRRAPHPHQPMRFAGVADPIFNRADFRWPGRDAWFLLTARWGMKDAVEMARLVATEGEVKQAAALWPASRILRGPDVSVAGISSLLEWSPRIFHVASHMLRRTADSSPAIVLGLDRNAGLKLWTASDIAAIRNAPEYVALSGCGSGTGPVLRGAGLQGLTRAWLTAGTRAVVASYWPTPEESDWIFIEYYRRLREGTDPNASRRAAIALREAQMEAIRLGAWRGRTWYWGAYFVIGAL
ncbi:MAG: CHAT domain-containing tetratricopeptide repeat protein [Bryobacteraceae bacterium]|nr:CHAT domain-containing tetratricopeptide repeat protein [Bryobacteraceae bacterium]